MLSMAHIATSSVHMCDVDIRSVSVYNRMRPETGCGRLLCKSGPGRKFCQKEIKSETYNDKTEERSLFLHLEYYDQSVIKEGNFRFKSIVYFLRNCKCTIVGNDVQWPQIYVTTKNGRYPIKINLARFLGRFVGTGLFCHHRLDVKCILSNRVTGIQAQNKK